MLKARWEDTIFQDNIDRYIVVMMRRRWWLDAGGYLPVVMILALSCRGGRHVSSSVGCSSSGDVSLTTDDPLIKMSIIANFNQSSLRKEY
jgi:hypothetical protein